MRRILMLGLLLINGSVVNANDLDLARKLEIETNAIEQVGVKPVPGVFNVALFQGQIPVPNRFLVVMAGSGGGIEFNSLNLEGPTGVIRVGRFEYFQSKYADKYKNLAKRELDKYGLKVVIFEPPHDVPRLAGIQTVVIHDSNQFLLITDQNPRLWEAMLDAYGRTIGAK